MKASIDFLKRQAEIRCVILKSKNPNMFCAGADLKVMKFNNSLYKFSRKEKK